MGNRVEVVSADRAISSRFDWAGRLVRHADESCSHDKAGSLTRWQGDGSPVRCAFTAENALAAVERKGKRVDYRYDGDGRLLSRTSERRTEFVVDPQADFWRPLLAQEQDGRRIRSRMAGGSCWCGMGASHWQHGEIAGRSSI
jgi:YD repeat-containing protein